MTVHELVTTTQSLPFELRKALIKALFEQLPKTNRWPVRSPRSATWKQHLCTSESWSAARFNAALNSCVTLKQSNSRVSVYATDTHPLIWYASRTYRQLSHRALRVFEQAENGEAFILIPVPVLWKVSILEKH
jgi:hypothetical protein